MKILTELRSAGRGRDMTALIEAIPFARFLGVQVDIKGNELTTILPFRDQLVGNHRIQALHGGAIGAFIEITALVHLLFTTECERLPKTVDIGVDYLRSGRPQPTYGRAFITKHGRRVANVRVELWQEETQRPIAAGHGHFLLTPA